MELVLRRATFADARFVWDVNNDPAVRAQSIHTASIPWESHEGWFRRKVADEATLFFIALAGGTPAGVVRFDLLGDGSATISVAVASSLRGKGLGVRIIAEASSALAAALPGTRAIAMVRPSNQASIRAFERAGYERTGSEVEDGVALERFERSC